MTICKDCKFVIHKVTNDNCPGIWYHWYCGAKPLEPRQDPVTGGWGFGGCNSLGKAYTQSEAHPFCSDINHGECPDYEEKK